MGISLWRACARNVRIARFHTQESARPIRAAAWRNGASWRSFSRSVGVPAETVATPRRAQRALRRAGETGGATIGTRGASLAKPVGKPEPGANRREAFRNPCAGRRKASSGRIDAPDGPASLCAEAGASGPIFPRSQGADGPAPQDGPARVRPRPARDRCEGLVVEAGGTGHRADARSAADGGRTGRSGERPALRRAAPERTAAGFPRRKAGRGDDAKRVSPWGSGSRSAGTSDGSCGSGVRPAPEASGGVLPGTRRVLAREPGNLTPPFFKGRRIGDQPLSASPFPPPRAVPAARRALIAPRGGVLPCLVPDRGLR